MQRDYRASEIALSADYHLTLSVSSFDSGTVKAFEPMGLPLSKGLSYVNCAVGTVISSLNANETFVLELNSLHMAVSIENYGT